MKILSLLLLLCLASTSNSQNIFRFSADSAICYTQKQVGFSAFEYTDTLYDANKHQVSFTFVAIQKADSQFVVSCSIITKGKNENISARQAVLIQAIPHPAHPGKYISTLQIGKEEWIQVVSDQPVMAGNISIVSVELEKSHWHFYGKPKEKRKAF